jgi:hypothetical protein
MNAKLILDNHLTVHAEKCFNLVGQGFKLFHLITTVISFFQFNHILALFAIFQIQMYSFFFVKYLQKMSSLQEKLLSSLANFHIADHIMPFENEMPIDSQNHRYIRYV